MAVLAEEVEVSDSYEQLHKQVLLPCVRVRTDRAGGSGTVVYSKPNDKGETSTYVLTNHHVIDDLIKVVTRWDPILQRDAKRDERGLAQVEFFNYRWQSRAIGQSAIEAEISAYDKDEDLALLKLRGDQSVPAVAQLYPRGEENKLRVGQPVFAVGCGLGEPPVLTEGRLSQFGRELEHKEFWLNSAPSIYGNSGGALFSAESHELVGVPARVAVTGMLFVHTPITHLSYAIPITRVYGFCEKHLHRFVYDSGHTEESEVKERDRRRKADKERMKVEEERRG